MTNINSINKEIREFLKLLNDGLKSKILQYDGSKLQLNLLSDVSEGKSILEKVFNEVNF